MPNKDGFEPGQDLTFADLLTMRGGKVEAKPAVPQSPDEIDDMKKAEVKEWLDAHGADTSGNVGEMRDRLKSVMFVGG
jgi:hypothetical protein